MLHDLLSTIFTSNSIPSILLQKLSDEISELIRVWYASLVGKHEIGTEDCLILGTLSPIAERSLSKEHLIHDYTDCPPVGRKAIAIAGTNLFWRHVSWCAAFVIAFHPVSQHGRQTEVNQLKVAVGVEH